jgi:soluble lytic murein transglycosylase-like protein
MTLTKNPRPVLAGLSLLMSGGLVLGALGRPTPAISQPAHSGAKKTTRNTGTNKTSAADRAGESEISPEIAALWRAPSSGFAAAFARVGEEPRDQSIDKIRKFLASGQNAVFGLNLGGDGSPTEKQAASYALARLLTKGKNSQPSPEERKEALALYEKSAALNCLHVPSLWHMSETISSTGDETATRAILQRISDDPMAGDSDTARAQYELAQSLLRTPSDPGLSAGAGPGQGSGQVAGQGSGQSDNPTAGIGANAAQAKTILLSIREKYPSSEYAKGSCYYLAQAAMTEANGSPTPAAVSYLREYLKTGSGGRFSSEVADKLMALSQPATGGAPATITLTADDLEQIAAIYYKRGDLTKALGIYDKLGADAKLLQRAQCYAKLGRKADAVAAILAAVKQDPTSSTYDDYAATVCVPLTKDEAADLWRKILALNPKHADHALYNLATRIEEKDAVPLLAKLLNQFPTSEHAPESLWWVFWYETKKIYPASVVKEKEKTAALLRLVEQGLARYPQHRVAARLAFWGGKLYEKLGQNELAKKEYELAAEKYPTNYYGARARARLHYLIAAPDKRHDRGFSVSANRLLSPENWSWPQPPNLFSFDKVAPLVGSQAMVLAITHQGDECLAKVDGTAAARAESGADHIAVDCLRGWLYLNQGQQIEGIRAAGHDLDGYPTKSPRWQILYPWAYSATINEAAHKNSVDPFLVHALIREESRYFPMALSRSNAIGLMQLLPGTAFGVAKRIGLSISSKDEIFIPENNIKMGTAYLAYTLGRFDGQAMLAVASYNGGPNAVKHWVDQFHAKGLSDWDIFVENIPFRETRDYVRKVFGSYWTYELIYQ